MEGPEAQSSELAPAQRLRPRLREVLLEYARTGNIVATAEKLGVSPQTVKNHLSEAYRHLGVSTGPQAIYVLMGGEDVARTLPPPSIKARRPKAKTRAVNLQMPKLVDHEMSIADLRLAVQVADTEAKAGAEPDCPTCGLSPLRATLTEFVEWLSLYVRPQPVTGTG